MSKDKQQNTINVEQAASSVNVETKSEKQSPSAIEAVEKNVSQTSLEKELNGPKGLEPTRYGDWEAKGRCYDF